MPPQLRRRFEVSVTSRTLIRASDPPPEFPAVLPVSNLDLILGSFNVSLILLYPAAGFPFPAVAAATRAALPSFLSRFFPFAGRVVADAATGIPEIACNNAGAELVLADAGDVALADVDFADADTSFGAIQLPYEQGVALSLQLVRFKCGGFSVSWGTNHLLVDGHGLTSLPNAWAELVRGELSWEPRHERRSLLRPRSPPRYGAALDAEFTRYSPANLVNPLLAAALVRRSYVVSAADLARLRAAASTPSRRATRLEALSAHVWKLLAAATATTTTPDPNCRLAWLVDGRRRLDPTKFNTYLGNVITYASKEAAVETIAASPLADVAAMAGAAIGEVFREERYQELVDWMEIHKTEAYGDGGGGKWTETVGIGTGSPAMVVSAFVAFKVDGDFGFGKPAVVMPWVRPGRLGSAAMTVARSPSEDGSWVVMARLWPRLADVIDADTEAVFKPATAERLGLVRRCKRGGDDVAAVARHASRL
uniref:Uncharacterized protein n=1 Tax=Leersia perrieri TaxID=77586 RepID=A0A0D9WLZ4_9ORYZ